jgi:hypothetical protein
VGQKKWREQREEQRQEGLRKKNCHEDEAYISIPMMESLGPRFEWTQILP